MLTATTAKESQLEVQAEAAGTAVVLDKRMGRLAMELLTKAALCAIGVALFAGMAAALLIP
jgi:hypothetical protein